MKLSNLQAMMLFQTLRDSCVVADSANIFTFDAKQRKKLAEEIMNQQSRDTVDLDITEHLLPLHNGAVGVEGSNDET